MNLLQVGELLALARHAAHAQPRVLAQVLAYVHDAHQDAAFQSTLLKIHKCMGLQKAAGLTRGKCMCDVSG